MVRKIRTSRREIQLEKVNNGGGISTILNSAIKFRFIVEIQKGNNTATGISRILKKGKGTIGDHKKQLWNSGIIVNDTNVAKPEFASQPLKINWNEIAEIMIKYKLRKTKELGNDIAQYALVEKISLHLEEQLKEVVRLHAQIITDKFTGNHIAIKTLNSKASLSDFLELALARFGNDYATVTHYVKLNSKDLVQAIKLNESDIVSDKKDLEFYRYFFDFCHSPHIIQAEGSRMFVLEQLIE